MKQQILHETRARLSGFALQLIGVKTVHCLGDSHLEAFEHLANEGLLKRTRFRFCVVQGATAMGIANPASQTQAMPAFMKYLDNIRPGHFVLTCLGEVDCGFVIWYRSKHTGEPVHEQYERAVANYMGFLAAIRARGLSRIIVCSVPLPTIPDGRKWEFFTLRNEVDATMRERTDMTLQFNDRLRAYCREQDLIFLDLEARCLNPETRIIRDKYLNPDQLNHHLYKPAIGHVIAEEMRRKGFA